GIGSGGGGRRYAVVDERALPRAADRSHRVHERCDSDRHRSARGELHPREACVENRSFDLASTGITPIARWGSQSHRRAGVASRIRSDAAYALAEAVGKATPGTRPAENGGQWRSRL